MGPRMGGQFRLMCPPLSRLHRTALVAVGSGSRAHTRLPLSVICLQPREPDMIILDPSHVHFTDTLCVA
jgi:hypothetical protein